MKAFVGAVGAFVFGFVLLAIPMMGSTSSAASVCSPTGGPPLSVLDGEAIAAWGSYSAEQMTNAATIVRVGAEKNVPARGQQIALMTAIEESGLIPQKQAGMSASDPRTAWGIFQQTPSQGWGTREQVMDVEYASGAFYDALLKVAGWESMTPATLAAHAVQGNADPHTYQPSWVPAGELLGQLTGAVGAERSAAASDAPTLGAQPVPGVSAVRAASSSSAGRSGTGTVFGEMPTGIRATPSGPVEGGVLVANANIKLRSGLVPGLAALAAPRPDFITLNEVGDVPLTEMRSAAPGYDAYRDGAVDGTPGGGEQSMNNAIMWRADTWTLLDGGRVKIVDDDHVVTRVGDRLWDRYAIWGVFQRADGAVVSVVAVHHMTNAYRYPRQWGTPPMTRVQQYGLGMDRLIQLAGVLAPYGPVLVGGDLNSHPNDGPLAAAPKMAAAGFEYTKDSGVIYNFYAAPVSVARTWEISAAAVHSDHPALFTEMSFNGAEPGVVVDYCDASVSDAGGEGFLVNAAATSVGSFTQAQLIARAQEFAAGGGGWFQRCQNFVAQLAGRPNSGFESAASAMAVFESTGVFHSANDIDGYAPPVGAWLYYSNDGNPYGHVVTYLGNGQVAGTDTWRSDYVDIGPASDITNGLWHLTYEGWAVPWATPATDVAVMTPLPAEATTPAPSEGP